MTAFVTVRGAVGKPLEVHGMDPAAFAEKVAAENRQHVRTTIALALAGDWPTLSRYGLIADDALTDDERFGDLVTQIVERYGGRKGVA